MTARWEQRFTVREEEHSGVGLIMCVESDGRAFVLQPMRVAYDQDRNRVETLVSTTHRVEVASGGDYGLVLLGRGIHRRDISGTTAHEAMHAMFWRLVVQRADGRAFMHKVSPSLGDAWSRIYISSLLSSHTFWRHGGSILHALPVEEAVACAEAIKASEEVQLALDTAAKTDLPDAVYDILHSLCASVTPELFEKALRE